MTRIASASVTIQTFAESVPSTPVWFGEVAVIAHYLRHLGVLAALKSACALPGVGLAITT